MAPPAPKAADADAALTEDRVIAIVVEAVSRVEAKLEELVAAAVAAELSKRATQDTQMIANAVTAAMAEALAESPTYGDGLTPAVLRELHVLGGMIDNVATTLERSVGQPVTRIVAGLEDGSDVALPSSRWSNYVPPAGVGPETAEGVGL